MKDITFHEVYSKKMKKLKTYYNGWLRNTFTKRNKLISCVSVLNAKIINIIIRLSRIHLNLRAKQQQNNHGLSIFKHDKILK